MKRWIALFSGVFVLAAATSARAQSSVVGVSDRHEFGRWAWSDELPRLFVGFGVAGSVVTLRDTSLSGGTKTAPIQGPGGAIDGTKLFATSFEIRPRVFLGGPIYLGPYIGVGPAFTTHVATNDGAQISGSGFAGQLGGVLGLRARPFRGKLSLSLETVVAARIVSLSVEQGGQSWIASAVTPIVQPRLQIDGWTSPFSSIGVWFGADALHDHDVAGGLAFTFHIAPYDENPP